MNERYLIYRLDADGRLPLFCVDDRDEALRRRDRLRVASAIDCEVEVHYGVLDKRNPDAGAVEWPDPAASGRARPRRRSMRGGRRPLPESGHA